MYEVLVQRIAWCRRGRSRHYVGTLTGGSDGLRLAGREPASGIEVSLSIPYPEIGEVRLGSDGERLAGEESVVLEFNGSEPILLREIGLGQLRPPALVARLKEALR